MTQTEAGLGLLDYEELLHQHFTWLGGGGMLFFGGPTLSPMLPFLIWQMPGGLEGGTAGLGVEHRLIQCKPP